MQEKLEKVNYYNDFQECKTLSKLLNLPILPRPQWGIYYFMGLDIKELFFSNTIFRVSMKAQVFSPHH